MSSSETPLRWRVPTVICGRLAGPGDSGGEPCHAVHLFSNELDAELVDQPSCVCFPDSSRPFTGCVLLWSDGGCRHEFTSRVFELLSELELSRHAKGSNPVFEKWSAWSRMFLKFNWFPAFFFCKHEQIDGCCVTKLSVCAMSCRQAESRMILTLANIASQLQWCANCSRAASSDTYSSGKRMTRGTA